MMQLCTGPLSDLPRSALPRPIQWFNRSHDRRNGGPEHKQTLHRDEFGTDLPPRLDTALDVLCRSLSQGQLHPFGRLYARALIRGALQARAEVDAYIAAHPEVEDVPLNKPIIIYGLQRSGTTFLHRLLAESDGARPLRLWELLHPTPPAEGRDLRRLKASAVFHAFRATAPKSLDAIHYMRPNLPDECQFLFRLDLRSPVLWTALAALDYAAWLFDEDMNESCQLYRKVLQIFQAKDPNARLVLKNPGHALYIEALHHAVPEATFVQTHRDPASTVASQAKLALTAQSAMTKEVDPRDVINATLRMQSKMTERSLAFEGDVAHVRYEDLVSDPMASVSSIFAHHRLPLRPTEAIRMKQHIRVNRQHRHGRNPYTLEQFGLSRPALDEHFAAYSSRFLETPC